MTLKMPFGRILEKPGNLVHVEPPMIMDQVTLCGITDWLGSDKGYPTDKAVTCQGCRWIVEYCQSHRKLRPRRRPLPSQNQTETK